MTTYPVTIKNTELLSEHGFIAGEWVEAHSKKTQPVHNPATQKLIGSIPWMDQRETKLAIESASKVLPHWKGHTALERANMLMNWYRLILANESDLAAILTSENGKPLAEAKGEIAYAASFIRWFAEEGRRIYGRHVPHQKHGTRIMVIQQPIGVTFAITPWNFPAAMVTRKLAPALAAGCPMIVKCSEFTPYTAIALIKLAEQAGFSKANGLAGVIQLLTGDAVAIGKEACTNPIVKKISLTGSTRVGKILMEQSATTLKKLSLELGGNAPFIVFEDADLDKAVAGALICKYRNSGQTCVCANRIFVHKKLYKDFIEKLTAAVSQFKVADGFTPDAQIGPLINDAAFTKVQHHVSDATAHGAQITTGGKPLAHLGKNFYAPTVLSNVSPDALLNTEETFGPVGGIIPFQTEAEVIATANNTPYGLAAYFYSRDVGRVWRVAESIEAGIIGINEGIISYETAPFGGIKESGMGREGATEGIQEYLYTKYLLMGGIDT
ncbi:glutarate-semialdehyde dehydrogenase DavD [Spirochaetota bacterium]|nr:glutarate-semialdehyde dehydrogenase DavD [Spirochaetota bacterium]